MCALDTDAIRASGRCWIKYNANTCIMVFLECVRCVCVCAHVRDCVYACECACGCVTSPGPTAFLLYEINMIHNLNLLSHNLFFALPTWFSSQVLCWHGCNLCMHLSAFEANKTKNNTNKCTRFTESCPFFHRSITPAKTLSLKSLDSLLACCIKHTTDKAIHFLTQSNTNVILLGHTAGRDVWHLLLSEN